MQAPAHEPAKIAVFIAAPVLVDAMPPSFYAPLSFPSYGGWEPAQFNNDDAQPWQQRHDAKRAALEVTR